MHLCRPDRAFLARCSLYPSPVEQPLLLSAGFDGWMAPGVKLVLNIVPFLIEEMYQVWLHTTRCLVTKPAKQDATLRALQLLVFFWRVIDRPKQDEHESPPMGLPAVA